MKNINDQNYACVTAWLHGFLQSAICSQIWARHKKLHNAEKRFSFQTSKRRSRHFVCYSPSISIQWDCVHGLLFCWIEHQIFLTFHNYLYLNFLNVLIPCIILSLRISFSVTAIFPESFKHSKTLKTHLQEEPVYLWGTKQSKDQKMQIQSQSNNKQEIKTYHKLCFCYQGKQTTALVSYPGSGNTWLRHLLQLASGKHHTHLRHLQLIIFE